MMACWRAVHLIRAEASGFERVKANFLAYCYNSSRMPRPVGSFRGDCAYSRSVCGWGWGGVFGGAQFCVNRKIARRHCCSAQSSHEIRPAPAALGRCSESCVVVLDDEDVEKFVAVAARIVSSSKIRRG
jgi:hypothetical protein